VNATILFCDADDWTGHRTVRRTDQTFVEQVLNLTVDLGFDSVGYPLWPHLAWNEICGGLDTMHHRITPPWMVAELSGKFVEQLEEILSLFRHEVCNLFLRNSSTG